MLVYLLEFVVFGILGWVIDSTYCSIDERRFVSSGYFVGVPFCPIYGFGGILLLNSFVFFSLLSGWMTVLLTTLLVVCLEYAGGRLAEYLLDERLWDYSEEKWNLNGYISAWHSLLWLGGVSVLYLIFDRREGEIISLLESRLYLDQRLNVLLVFGLLFIGLFLTSKTKNFRLSRLEAERVKFVHIAYDVLDVDRWRKISDKKRRELVARWNKIKN